MHLGFRCWRLPFPSQLDWFGGDFRSTRVRLAGAAGRGATLLRCEPAPPLATVDWVALSEERSWLLVVLLLAAALAVVRLAWFALRVAAWLLCRAARALRAGCCGGGAAPADGGNMQ